MNNLLIKFEDLSEPPLIEDGYRFSFIIPRERVPRNFWTVLEDHGLKGEHERVPQGLQLSFNTTNYAQYQNLKRQFLRAMPWSDEILRYWDRGYKFIKLFTQVDDKAAEQLTLDAETPTPMAASHGLRSSPEMIERFQAA